MIHEKEPNHSSCQDKNAKKYESSISSGSDDRHLYTYTFKITKVSGVTNKYIPFFSVKKHTHDEVFECHPPLAPGNLMDPGGFLAPPKTPTSDRNGMN